MMTGIVLFCSARACAQTEVAREPIAIVEIGVSPNWSTTGSGSNVSPTIAFEFTPIENWLEIEIGVTPTFAHRSTEWATDFLFKKPWTLSKKLELMAGVGPSYIHARENGITTNSVAGEAVLEFMFWPTAKRRFGWYFEPGYEYNFGKGHEQSIGFIGLLIAIRR